MMGAISRAGTTYPSITSEFNNCPHVASLGLINLILRKPVFALTPEYCMLIRKAANINFSLWFDLTGA
jgi:hypothetical protein